MCNMQELQLRNNQIGDTGMISFATLSEGGLSIYENHYPRWKPRKF